MKILVIVIMLSLIFSPATFAMEKRIRSGKISGETSQTTVSPIGIEAGKTEITKEEYNKKIKSAKTTRLTGIVLASVGGATFVSGIAYLATAVDGNKKGFSAFSNVKPAVIGGSLIFGGLALGVAGGVTALIGNSKKHKVEKNYYYTLVPAINPINGNLGLAFNGRF